MKDTIIFDLDGTLANCEHRVHHVRNEPVNWKAFFEACVQDRANEHTLVIWNALYETYPNLLLAIFSGRSDVVRPQTEHWLKDFGLFYNTLRMRPAGDRTPDEVLKERWLHEYGKDRVFCVFDDRKKVVDMWRRNGIPCFQVAEGNF